jgi:hypothetical protein
MATPPQFWGYPWGEDLVLLPGDSVPIAINNLQGLGHYFKVMQAQHLHATCDDELELSWAVTADLP